MAGLFEALESRKLLATFTVLNTNDAGAGSLRQAILDANALAGADVIEFADAAATVIAVGTQLSITGNLTITGRDGVEISGGDATRIFEVAIATTVSMSDLTIRDGRYTGGAGILNAGSLTLRNVTLSNNSVNALGTGAGGAIFNSSSGTLALTNCLITGNSASGGSSGNGAGISNSGTLTITNSTISNNTATSRGGGILNSGTTTIIGSTFSNNLAYNVGGGAIMAIAGEILIVNSTLSGNGTDESGGAVHLILGSSAEIHNSTITANNALDLGDGLYVDPASSLLLTSSIVAANGTADIAGTLAPGSTNNLVKDDTENGGLVNGVNANLVGVDPLLGALADNGGQTQTYALLAGSPAINAGTNASGQATTDQRGPLFTRVGTPDIGAYELMTLALVVDSLGDAEDGDFSAGNISLREALDATNGNPGADSITFSPALNNGTIVLADFRLRILDDVSITGPGASLLQVTPSAQGGFFIDYDTAVTIDGLSISDGYAPSERGTGISNRGVLTLANVVMSNNRSGARAITYDGGALFNIGTATISNSQFVGNSAADGGGAIYNDGTMTISNSQFTDNSAGYEGGAIYSMGSLTISSSTISENDAGDRGGAVYSSAEFTISSSTISGNTSVTEGGGIYSRSGALSINETTIANNTAGEFGGGVFAFDCPVDISGSTVTGNTATRYGGGIGADTVATFNLISSEVSNNQSVTDSGGGLFLTGVAITYVAGSTITGNSSAAEGGGISADDCLSVNLNTTTISGNQTSGASGGALSIDVSASVDISACTIESNTASTRGGGLVLDDVDNASIRDSVIAGNTAGDSGGGLYANDGGAYELLNTRFALNVSGNYGGGLFLGGLTSVELAACDIAENTATNDGGGVRISGSSLSMIDSAVRENVARSGGGVWAGSGSELAMISTTFSSNSATTTGGALFSQSSIPAQLHNCTIVGNTAPDTGGVEHSNSDLVAISTIIAGNSGGDIKGLVAAGSTNNLIEDAATAGGLTNGVDGNIVGVDPLLGPLANNGGPTRTHRILPGSPAINAGANPDALTTDQRGFQRVRGTAIDIGAVEFVGGPSVASLTASTSPLPLGLSAMLTAGGVTDPDGSVSGVRFYLDANANGIGETGELLFNDTNAADGFKYLYETDSGDSIGTKRFLAVGYDEDGVTGTARLATISVTDPASIGSPVGAANSANVHRVATVNTIGHVLVYRQGWTYEDLTEKTGAPIATSPAITWVDPKNGLAYVAATSASGLLLFTRSASGTWSFRNLSTETGATGSPAGNLTHFISQRRKIVVIAGITSTGRVVAFRQALAPTSPGVHAYTFIDISADLESQGQTTPALTGLTSYVPSWDTWHLAGVDTMGRIQSIWINTNNPAFTKWRTDNLSAITGAPALSGQLAVTLTSWGGINLTGLDTAGNMLTTWWVPRFAGQWAVSNLTTRYGGPQLVGGNLTAYTTPWGGINYVGLDSAGDVRVYWWVPSFGGTWAISRLLPSSTPDESVPTGRLTSHASAAGTLNVFGTNASGDLLRLAWQPGPGSAWAVENLTETAVEV